MENDNKYDEHDINFDDESMESLKIKIEIILKQWLQLYSRSQSQNQTQNLDSFDKIYSKLKKFTDCTFIKYLFTLIFQKFVHENFTKSSHNDNEDNTTILSDILFFKNYSCDDDNILYADINIEETNRIFMKFGNRYTNIHLNKINEIFMSTNLSTAAKNINNELYSILTGLKFASPFSVTINDYCIIHPKSSFANNKEENKIHIIYGIIICSNRYNQKTNLLHVRYLNLKTIEENLIFGHFIESSNIIQNRFDQKYYNILFYKKEKS